MSNVQWRLTGRRIVRLVLGSFALLAAAVQFNDPDPVYWVVVYTATAVVVASQALGYFSRFWSAVVMGGILAGMLMTVIGLGAYLQSGDLGSITGEMLASKPYVEQAREFLGLSLALILLAWCYKTEEQA